VKVHYVLWTRRDLRYAGKLTLVPEDETEAQALRIFKAHVGLDQSGRRLDVVFRWRDQARKARFEALQTIAVGSGIGSSQIVPEPKGGMR
jgi:hypothetical protein